MTKDYIALDKAATLEGIPYHRLQKRLRRSTVALMNDPEDSRRKLMPLTALSPKGYENWLKEVAARAFQPHPSQAGPSETTALAPTSPAALLQPALPFEWPPDRQEQIDSAVAATPHKFRDYVAKWMGIIANCDNGTYMKFSQAKGAVGSWHGIEIRNNDDFIRALAQEYGLSASNIYEKRRAWRATETDPRVLAAPVAERAGVRYRVFCEAITPKPRPGRSSAGFFAQPENGWMLLKLKDLYKNPTKLSPTAAHQLLLREIDAKQRAWGLEHLYDRPTVAESKAALEQIAKPTLWQVRTALENIPARQLVQRDGSEAVKIVAGYIDRHYDDEFPGDAWCIDEWEIDCYPYDDENHRVVYNYGKHQPILHLLSAIDERTTYIMGWLVTDQVDADSLELAEELLRGYWAPLRLVTDRAGRFRQLAHGHVVMRESGELAEKMAGPLGELGVRPRGSPEKNPRANRIERMHGIYSQKAQRDFGLAWRPPKSRRKATGIDDRVIRHLREHCKQGLPTELIPISQVVQSVAQWVEEINGAETEAKGCKGLTRAAAFKYFRPPDDEIARRRVEEARIDWAFAEHDERTVQSGGVIQLADGARYSAAELGVQAGELVKVCRYRRDKDHLFVEFADRVVVADRRIPVGIYTPELLSQQCERLAHLRKQMTDEVNRVTPSAEGSAADGPTNANQISSVEWMTERLHQNRKVPVAPEPPRFANERAAAVLEAMEEETEVRSQESEVRS